MEINDNRKSLSKIRFKNASEDLILAHKLIASCDYKLSANRSYYAIFHAMRAILALNAFDSKKHSGVISEFRKLYIKTNLFPVKMSDIITDLFKIRINCDYEDFYVVSKKEVEIQIENAEYFLKEIKKFLKNKKIL